MGKRFIPRPTMKDELKNYFMITVGLTLYAFTWKFFMAPFKFVTGGITGVTYENAPPKISGKSIGKDILDDVLETVRKESETDAVFIETGTGNTNSPSGRTDTTTHDKSFAVSYIIRGK